MRQVKWQVIFTDRKSAEAEPVRPDWAVISISEPPAPEADLKKGWHSILRLEFHDIERWEEEYKDKPGFIHFSEQDANRIIDFVGGLPDDLAGILIHCRAGISRSTAVAKWICETHGMPFPKLYSAHNHSVLSMLESVAYHRKDRDHESI